MYIDFFVVKGCVLTGMGKDCVGAHLQGKCYITSSGGEEWTYNRLSGHQTCLSGVRDCLPLNV